MKKKKAKAKPKAKRKSPDKPARDDGRGKRPTDPNQLAKWILDQTTE